MIVYAVVENGHHAGYSLTDDLNRERQDYIGTPLALIEIASADEQTARNIVDYLTYVKDNSSLYQSPEAYGITAESRYTLSEAGQLVWPPQVGV